MPPWAAPQVNTWRSWVQTMDVLMDRPVLPEDPIMNSKTLSADRVLVVKSGNGKVARKLYPLFFLCHGQILIWKQVQPEERVHGCVYKWGVWRPMSWNLQIPEPPVCLLAWHEQWWNDVLLKKRKKYWWRTDWRDEKTHNGTLMKLNYRNINYSHALNYYMRLSIFKTIFKNAILQNTILEQ